MATVKAAADRLLNTKSLHLCTSFYFSIENKQKIERERNRAVFTVCSVRYVNAPAVSTTFHLSEFFSVIAAQHILQVVDQFNTLFLFKRGIECIMY